jgi:hypothetical protein
MTFKKRLLQNLLWIREAQRVKHLDTSELDAKIAKLEAELGIAHVPSVHVLDHN